MVIGFNCAYVLSFSNLMMVPLGWAWGVACLLLVGAAAWYANWLLAGLHFVDGRRFIRYRDLMGFVFGTHIANSSNHRGSNEYYKLLTTFQIASRFSFVLS